MTEYGSDLDLVNQSDYGYLLIYGYDRYPSLRVAYIDEVEEPSKDATKKVNDKVYY